MTIEDKLNSIEKKQEETLALVKELHTSGVVDNKDRLYDLTDLEGILKCCRRTLFKRLKSGILRHAKIGKKIYVDEKSLQEFLALNKQD